MNNILIDISESDEDNFNISLNSSSDNISDNNSNSNNISDNNSDSSNSDSDSNNNNSSNMYLVYNNNVNPEDPDILEFINFCIENELFDNTFYDYKNIFSAIATKLPNTYEKLSEDYLNVDKDNFIVKFKELGYDGNIKFIYKCIDVDKKGFITWDEFIQFFLPYIKFITM